MSNDRTMTPEQHAWRVYCAIRVAKARLACLETVGHVQDDDVGDGAADCAGECYRLVGETVGMAEAGFVAGKAEAYLLAIRALNLIAGSPQVTGEPDGWGYDTDRLDAAANWLHGALGDLVHNVEPYQWLERDDQLRDALKAKRGAA